jgi:predicted nucleotidyltransferase
MTERDEVLSVLKRDVMIMKDRFGVRRIGLFGSVARDEAGVQSDIDILIELDSESVSYQKYLDLEEYLQSLFSRKVEIVTSDGISKNILPNISREVVWV